MQLWYAQATHSRGTRLTCLAESRINSFKLGQARNSFLSTALRFTYITRFILSNGYMPKIMLKMFIGYGGGAF